MVFRPVSNWQDDVENLENYRWGGYHPIRLGDELSNRRYHIVHKLGYGRSATVWLARDCVEHRYVSLKVITANLSKMNPEIDVRNRLSRGDRHHPGRRFVLSPLDGFYIDGPNGRHLCLVSEVAGPSILDVKSAAEHGMLPIETAQNITTQLALGLSYIHSCGVIHNGTKFDVARAISDIHTHNVASQIPNIDSWTAGEFYENFGEPEKSWISRCDNEPLGPEAPPYAVPPACFWSIGEENLSKQIKIIDFGEASFSQDERKKLHTPMPFRAPESFFGELIGPPADIWAFGCTVFNIFANGHLFDGFKPSKDTILVEMVDSLGILPPQWWEKWESRSLYFSSHRAPNNGITTHDLGSPKPLALRIQEMRSGGDQPEGALRPFKSHEMFNLQQLLAATLKYLPSERATADDVSKLEWIQERLAIP